MQEHLPQQPDAAPADTALATPTTVLVNGKKLKKWPQDLYIPPQALEVFLETFQGPLDLLIYLIRKQNLDVLDIPVSHITSQYMEYIELMHHFKLDLAAEYLAMAAMLAEIKSRMLLPKPAVAVDEEVEDPRLALMQRLQEYERFSQAAQELEVLPQLERELYLANCGFDLPQPVQNKPSVSLHDITATLRNVLARGEQYKHWEVAQERLNVREKMTQILEHIHSNKFTRFEDLLDNDEGKPGLVVNFIAVLELMRDRMLIVVQNQAFEPVYVKGFDGGET